VLKDWSKKTNVKAERVSYTAEFTVDSNFGEPGAITMINNHQQEFFLESITIEGFATGAFHFPCNSWVQARKDLPGKRIFFSNKVFYFILFNSLFNYFFIIVNCIYLARLLHVQLQV
jgi:lipoxygenase